MNEKTNTLLKNANLNFNEMLVKGKIKQYKNYQGTHYYEVVLPAPDNYSSPQSVGIKSAQPIGNIGNEVEIKCVPRGFVKNFRDKQNMPGFEVKMQLEVFA